ncbi:hypothetical protein BGZ76_009157 [Entomortierella beljakovae]|nr:hypothetical protein BGZ76_009157 [Entomortierella beljakovae]
METEYLDAVNKEILGIELFFKQLYDSTKTPSSCCTTGFKPEVLPFLKPKLVDFPHNSHCTHNTVDYFSDESVAALQERYKQLKVVQDQLYLELTRLRIWKITSSTSNEIHSETSDAKPSKTSDAKPSDTPDTKLQPKVPIKYQDFEDSFSNDICTFFTIIVLIVALIWYFSSESEKQYPWPRY